MRGKLHHSNGTQMAALAVCLLILTGFVLTTAFILAHADHRHDQCGPDGGCATCAQLHNAGELLRQSVSHIGGEGSALLLFCAAATALCLAGLFSGIQTPVRLKTRLNQ